MRDFKTGDEVITFQVLPAANKWTAPKILSEAGQVIAMKDGKVWVDTLFGVMPFDPENVEWADVPF